MFLLIGINEDEEGRGGVRRAFTTCPPEAHGADLIVMGSRGLGDLQGLLLGSVSHKVGHLAKSTCITVR